MSAAPEMALLRDWPKGEPVPAISIRQPWAAAVVWLGKDVENRSRWLFKHRGPLLIHASSADFDASDVKTMLEIARDDGVPASVLKAFSPTKHTAEAYAQGDIVAVVRLADVFGKEGDLPEGHPAADSPWASDDAGYWLYLTDVEPCVPHPFKGQVGLFSVPYEVAKSLAPFSSTAELAAPTSWRPPAREAEPAHMEPLKPDPALAAIVGSEPLARTELTTRIWNYIVEHNLQDEQNERLIHCDNKLRAITGKDRVKMSELPQAVSEHIEHTTSSLDFRDDPDAAKAVISAFCRSADEQRLVLGQLLRSAEVAAAIAPNAWAVTLFGNGFRLNVGQVDSLEFLSGNVCMPLHGHLPTELERSGRIGSWPFTSVPEPRCKFVGTIAEFARWQSQLTAPHEAYLREAALSPSGKPRKGTPFAKAHSEGLMRHARGVVLGTE
jgi:upstream activation factor subunit UAF30